MDLEIKKFVVCSLRYQLQLAKHVANKCGTNVYVFDTSGFFDTINDIKFELIDGIMTIIKNEKRWVLSVAVKEAFGFNEDLFLKYIEENIALEKDDIGLYVETIKEKEEEEETIKKLESISIL